MSKNRKRINKSPIVVTRETDLTGTSNTPVRANGRGGGRFDGSIFIPTTPTGDGPTPTPIPTTTTSTTESEEITTTTTDNGEITTTTTDNGEITTTTTDNGETTTTTTIDYSALQYKIITTKNVQSFPGSNLPLNYVFGEKDSNGDFIYSDYDIKCIVENIPTGGYSSWDIGVENNSDEFLSVGDDELVRFLLGEVQGPFNMSARGYYNDIETRFGNTIDKYIINIVQGEVISIVSFESIGDVSGCNLPTDTTTTTTTEDVTTTTTTEDVTTTTTTIYVTTTTTLPQLNEVEGSNRFELNNSEIQTEYQNITDLAYSFQEAKDQDVNITQEVFDLVTYSHNQENEWDGYVDGDVVPMSVTNNTQKVYHYDELEIGSQLYDDSHNEITGSDMLYIHSDVINSNYNEELLEVQQNGGTLFFIGYEDGIVTELFSVILDFTGRVYPIATMTRVGNDLTCLTMPSSDGNGFHFSDEEIKKIWGGRTFPTMNNGTTTSSSYVRRIAVSDITEGSLSVGDESLVQGYSTTDIDSFTTFDGDLKGVYYDVYKRFSEVAELYVITIVDGTVTGIVNFSDINDILETPDSGISSIRRIYENNVTLPNGDTFNFGYGGNDGGGGITVNTGQELKCAVVNLGVEDTKSLAASGYDYHTELGLTIGTKLYSGSCLSNQSEWDGIYVFYRNETNNEEYYIFEMLDGVITTEPIVISELYLSHVTFFGSDVYKAKFIEDGSDGFNVCGEYAFPKTYRFEYDTDINGEIYTWTDRSLGNGEYIYSDEDIKCLYETGNIVNSKFDPPFICKLENTPLSVGDDELRATINNGADSMNWNDNIRGIYKDTDNRFQENVSGFNGAIREYLIDIVQGEVISIKRLDLIDDIDVCPPTTTTTTTISGVNPFIRLINWEFNNQLYVYELMDNQTVDSDFESIYCNEDVNFGNIGDSGMFSTINNSTYPQLGDIIYENEYSQTPLNEGVWLSWPWNEIEGNFELDKLAWYITDSNGVLVTISEITCPITTTTTTEDVTTTTTTDSPTTTTTTDSPTTTTTTTEDVTTTTTTIDYEAIVYKFYNSITPANSNTTYDFSDMTSALEVKCAWDHWDNNPNGTGGSASHNNTQESFNDGDYISIGDVMFGSGYTNPINDGYYSYYDGNEYLGNSDKWAIKIENGAIVSMDSFSSLPSCDSITTTTTEEVTTTTTTEEVTTTTTTEEVTTTTTTEDVTTTTTTVMYSLQTNYSVNGLGYNFRETTSPSSDIVTTELVTGTQTGAYLYNTAYLHTGITDYSYDIMVNGAPYISGSGVISVNMVSIPSGDILQVNTVEENPDSVYNVQITVIPSTTTTTTEDVTTTTTTEDVTTTTTTEDVTTTTTTEDVTTTTTTEDVTTTTTTEDVTTTTTTEDVTTTTTTENITTTTTYSLPPSYQYFKSTVLTEINNNVCEEPGYEVTSPFWVDETGYSIPNLLGKPIFRNAELTNPVMDGFYVVNGEIINSTDMSPVRWIQVISGMVSDVGVTDCDGDTPN